MDIFDRPTRYLFFMGKGGVGKTSLACATAVALADQGKRVLQEEGRIDLWQVRIKPGKPLAFGWLGGTPLVGPPGNPVAAAVAFEQFVRPAVFRQLGRTDLGIPTVLARVVEAVENRGGRRHFARVRVREGPDGYEAALVGRQGAGAVSLLAKVDGLLVIPEDLPAVEPGTVLPVQMLDWGL